MIPPKCTKLALVHFALVFLHMVKQKDKKKNCLTFLILMFSVQIMTHIWKHAV